MTVEKYININNIRRRATHINLWLVIFHSKLRWWKITTKFSTRFPIGPKHFAFHSSSNRSNREQNNNSMQFPFSIRASLALLQCFRSFIFLFVLAYIVQHSIWFDSQIAFHFEWIIPWFTVQCTSMVAATCSKFSKNKHHTVYSKREQWTVNSAENDATCTISIIIPTKYAQMQLNRIQFDKFSFSILATHKRFQ